MTRYIYIALGPLLGLFKYLITSLSLPCKSGELMRGRKAWGNLEADRFLQLLTLPLRGWYERSKFISL